MSGRPRQGVVNTAEWLVPRANDALRGKAPRVRSCPADSVPCPSKGLATVNSAIELLPRASMGYKPAARRRPGAKTVSLRRLFN
jgi:hypothetical protein